MDKKHNIYSYTVYKLCKLSSYTFQNLQVQIIKLIFTPSAGNMNQEHNMISHTF